MRSDSQDTRVSSALTKIDQVIDWAYEQSIRGISLLPGAKDFADEYLRIYHEPESAIDALIRWEIIKAGGVGFVTGTGGVLTLPIAISADFSDCRRYPTQNDRGDCLHSRL